LFSNIANTTNEITGGLIELIYKYTDQKKIKKSDSLVSKLFTAIAADSILYKSRFSEYLFVEGYISRRKGETQRADSFLQQCIQQLKDADSAGTILMVKALNEWALLNKAKGNLKKADTLYSQAISLFGKANLIISPDYCTLINNRAVLLYGMGNLNGAENEFLRVMALKRDIYGELHPQYLDVINNLIRLYNVIKNYDKAELFYIKSREIIKGLYGEKHINYLWSLVNLGGFYDDRAKQNIADSIFLVSLNTINQVKDISVSSYVSVMNEIAYHYFRALKFKKCDSLYKAAIYKAKEGLIESDDLYATVLNNYAQALRSLVRFQEAEFYMQQAVSLRKKYFGETNPRYAGSLNILGEIYFGMGRFEKAEPLYLESCEILKKSGNSDYYISGLRGLSNFYYMTNRLDKAEYCCWEALETCKKEKWMETLQHALILNDLGKIFTRQKKYNQADSVISYSLAIYKKTIAPKNSSLGLALVLGKKGGVLGEKNMFDSAVVYFYGALSMIRQLMGEKNPSFITYNTNLASLYFKANNFGIADSLYFKSLELTNALYGEKSTFAVPLCTELAGLNIIAHKYTAAENYVEKASQILTTSIKYNIQVMSAKDKQEYLQGQASLIDLDNSIVYRTHAQNPQTKTRILNSLLLLKGVVLNESMTLMRKIENTKDTAVKELYNNWIMNKAFLSKQYTLPDSQRSKSLKNIEREVEKQEVDLGRIFSDDGEKTIRFEIKSGDIFRSLKNSEAAVEFVAFNLYGDKGYSDSTFYAAYIITRKDSTPVFVPLFEEKQLQKLFDSAGTTANAMVSKFYRGLDMGNAGTAASLGKDLYKLVWAPLEPYLKGINKISYSPAGKLFGIAFHALPVDSTTLLMDKYDLNQYTSTRQVALRKKQEQNRKIQSITLFGDASFSLDSAAIAKTKTGNQQISNVYTPQYRGSRGGTWSELPGTAEEVKKVKQLFDQNRITTQSFTQTKATEENLKALSGNSPQVLHIATHGYFLPDPENKQKDISLGNENTYSLADDPLLRSGLILAGGNYAWSGKAPVEGVEDGIATAYEISQLNLSNTELVVLSACETALGDVKGSEGVFGLQRAFKMAGVKKMIVSLWQVPDKETAELMTTFYNYWLKGKSIEQAFAQAQADMRKKYSPYYWAAFVLVE